MPVVGVLGAGQLGRMLALAGYPLGLQFRFFDPAPEAPAEDLAERMVASFEDTAALRDFAKQLTVATYEFENVPVSALEEVGRFTRVSPSPQALAVGQDRWREKQCFERAGIPVPPYARVDSRADLERSLAHVGLPAMLKTRTMGYDGKGQAPIRCEADLEEAWRRLGGQPLLLERLVNFEAEVSILAVRSRSGNTVFYPLVENVHGEGILLRSRVPAPCGNAELEQQAREYARAVLEALDYAGVLAIEFFVEGGRLLANEMAPRVHNSGHWTIEGAETSQFENHLRAILDWPLGSTALRGPSVMYNVIGSPPPIERVLAIPGVHLHLYGKSPRPRRKLGHITVTAAEEEILRRRESELATVWVRQAC
ncbi:MAG: 5-(carboxyamino)imidazole ribonucleotide synthase [Candidatus Binatia bacterium]|nr:5-(carboxyamino)imidazole ribonucleotide synthase [Candidatus Binatia bacterium]